MYIQEYINNPHDKEIRKVLMNKKEGKIFINKSLKLKEEDKLKEANIENYTNSFVSNELKNKISDIVYKIVNRKELGEIYIIIEHQRAIDPRMRIRMCEYKSLVIRQALDEKQINAKGYKQPVVIGIVLYTGQKKWKEEEEAIEKEQRELKEYLNQSLIDYELVDTNEFEEEELLEADTVLSKIILLERVQSIQELKETIRKILKKEIGKETKEEIKRYVIAVFSRDLKINRKELKEVLKKLEEEGTEMMHIDEVLIRERDSWFEEGKSVGRKAGLADGIARGRKAGLVDGKKSGKIEERLKIIRKMIKGRVKDDLIKEYTNANEQELAKIKKEMQSQAV